MYSIVKFQEWKIVKACIWLASAIGLYIMLKCVYLNPTYDNIIEYPPLYLGRESIIKAIHDY